MPGVTRRLISGAVLFCCLCGVAVGQSATDVRNLKTYLFTNNSYDKTIRPATDQSLETHVYTEFYLYAINSLDEVTETLKTTASLQMYWTDDFLTWNPSDYGGLDYYVFPQNDVWKPDIALKNSFVDYKQLGHSSISVTVYNDGLVRWSTFQVFQSTCSIDITYFPYDTQRCSLTFVAWSYSKLEVYTEGGTNGIQLDDFEQNSAWDVIETSWYNHVETDEASIVFVLVIRRKPLYSLLTLVLPVIMLAILNLFVFTLPTESGRSDYAITVFLAFAVFMTIMQSTFPQNSETVAYFAIYVILETGQSTLITIIALITVRCASFDEKTKIPGFLIAFARFSKCKALRKKKRTNKVETTGKSAQVKTMDTITGIDNEMAVQVTDEDDSKPEKKMTWKDVISALDVFFTVVFVLAFLTATLVCLLVPKFR